REVEGAPERGRLRRHTRGADAVDHAAGADQHGAGHQVAARAGRLQGRHAVDGLADRGDAPHQEGPGRQGGWSAFHTYAIAADILNPISTNWMVADPAKAWFGWPSDPELEKLRDAYARE